MTIKINKLSEILLFNYTYLGGSLAGEAAGCFTSLTSMTVTNGSGSGSGAAASAFSTYDELS